MNEGLDLSSTLSKIKNSVSLSGKNRGFLANTFSTSQSIDKVELRGCLKSLNYYLPWRLEVAATRDFTCLACSNPKGERSFLSPLA